MVITKEKLCKQNFHQPVNFVGKMRINLRKNGQARKGARRMPWHWEPTKDVVSCEKPWGGANIH